jgi:hypothetical protein
MATPKPSRFFQHLGNIETEGSSAFLDAQQSYLRENKICGFIEIQINQISQVILLFANDVLAGTYLLENENSKSLQLINLSTVWDGRPTPIRTVEIPQVAGRLMWLALESPVKARMEFTGWGDLDQQINLWKSESFCGAVEIIAENSQGIVYIHEGNVLDSESFYFNDNKFENVLVHRKMQEQGALTVIVHKSSPASQAQQCLMLRQGVLQWGNVILSRYQDLVGQKMVRMAQKDIADITQPWGWHLSIENSTLRDEHFFSYAQTASQAYRAVFMELGNQMDQMVGSALTRRILNEGFEMLNKNTRMALELHRLIPAAFSE